MGKYLWLKRTAARSTEQPPNFVEVVLVASDDVGMPTKISSDFGKHISTSALIATLLDRGRTTEQIIRELTWNSRPSSAGLVRAVRHQIKSGKAPKKRRLQHGFQKSRKRKRKDTKSDHIRRLLTSHSLISNQEIISKLARNNISVTASLVRQVRFRATHR